MAMKEYPAFPRVPVLQDSQHQIVSCHILDTRWWSVTHLQRCSQCILQLQSTGPLVRGVLPLCRDAVSVFYNSNRLDHLYGVSYPSAEMQSVYSTTPIDWTTCTGSLTPLQRCSQCILQLQSTGPLVRGVLPLCRDAVSVFYNSNRLDHLYGESYPSAEMQSVYSTAPADWDKNSGKDWDNWKYSLNVNSNSS